MSLAERQTGENQLTRRAALLAVARVVAFALTLPLPLVLVRALSQSDFGLYKQVFQILLTALTLAGLNVSTSAYYFMPRNPDRKAHVAMNVLVFYAAIGSLVAISFAIYPQWVTLIFKSDELVPHVPLIGLAICLWLLSSLLEVVTVADGDIRSATAFIVMIQIARGALLIGAGGIFGTVHAIVLAAVIQGGLQCLMLFVYLRKRFGRFWRSFDGAFFRTQLTNALPFGIGGLAFALQADMHNYFVSHYFDPALFAIYAIGCFQFPLLGFLGESVISVMLPEVAKREAGGDYQSIITLWASAIRKLSFFFVPIYLLFFVVRHEMITVLFTENYVAAAPIFAINLLTIFNQITVPGSLFRAFDDLKYFRLKLSLAMLPVAGAALYVGVKTAGLVGAMAATVLIQNIDLLILLTVVGRKLGVNLKDLLRLAPVVKIAAAAAASGLAAFLVKLMMTGSHALVTLGVCSSVFGIVFMLLALLTGIVTEAEKAEMRAGVQRFARFGSKSMRYSSATEM